MRKRFVTVLRTAINAFQINVAVVENISVTALQRDTVSRLNIISIFLQKLSNFNNQNTVNMQISKYLHLSL